MLSGKFIESECERKVKKKPFFKKTSATNKKIKDKKGNLKNYRVEKVRLVIWAFIILFIFASFSSIVRSKMLGWKVANYKSEVVQLEKIIGELEKKQAIDTPTTDSFLFDFVSLYCEQYKDQEKQKDRLDRLSNYYKALGYQTDDVPLADTEVVNYENYGYEKSGKHYVGKCYVELKTKQENAQTFSFILCVPFQLKNNQYRICGLPYQQCDTRRKVISSNSEGTHQSPTDVLQDTKVIHRIEKFVDQFLQEYSDDDKENLKYLMKDVESLPSETEAVRKNIRVFHTAENPIVELMIDVKYPDTGIVFTENLQLTMSEIKDGKYFIDQLVHY